ncbi:hypothetical protein ACFVSW_17855 [Neobacillus sp. NPDC058068]|uniref:hypothetical protein n=1 Tax=Neobacillus sp. NPDC058068 TaxID=3346325 RepID=UPI0036DCBA48
MSIYSIVFTSILVLILIWKAYKLFKNKRNSGDFEGIDDELVIMLNEGDSIG